MTNGKQRFRVPIHPLAFNYNMACALFERDGWKDVGMEGGPEGSHLTYQVFERDNLPPVESYFDLNHWYLDVDSQIAFCKFVQNMHSYTSTSELMTKLKAQTRAQPSSARIVGDWPAIAWIIYTVCIILVVSLVLLLV